MNSQERFERFFRAFTFALFFAGLVMMILGTGLALFSTDPEYVDIGKFMAICGFATSILVVPS